MSTAPNPSIDGQPAGADVVNPGAAVGPAPTDKAPGPGLPASDASTPAGGPLASAESGWGYYPPDLQISDETRPGYQVIAQTMHDYGMATEDGAKIMSWLTELDATPTPTEQVAHKFDVRMDMWAEEDRPYLIAHLNRAAAAGWSQTKVDNAIRWFRTAIEPHRAADRAAQSRATEARDAADAKAGTRALKIQWGDEAAANYRTVRQYVASLPIQERQALEQKELPDGRLALNDPGFVQGLLKKAQSANGMTLDQIRKYMRENRAAYNKDEAAQSRYRALLRGEA